MNIIKQAAEAKYPYNGTPIRTEKERGWYKEDVTHFLSYLSQQGDEEVVTYLVEQRLTNTSLEKIIKQALAIGRATNRWIPVSERLPEEKDGNKYGDVLVTLKHGQWGDREIGIRKWKSVKRGRHGHWTHIPEPPIKNPS